jgi:hypothetical protein
MDPANDYKCKHLPIWPNGRPNAYNIWIRPSQEEYAKLPQYHMTYHPDVGGVSFMCHQCLWHPLVSRFIGYNCFDPYENGLLDLMKACEYAAPHYARK